MIESFIDARPFRSRLLRAGLVRDSDRPCSVLTSVDRSAAAAPEPPSAQSSTAFAQYTLARTPYSAMCSCANRIAG